MIKIPSPNCLLSLAHYTHTPYHLPFDTRQPPERDPSSSGKTVIAPTTRVSHITVLWDVCTAVSLIRSVMDTRSEWHLCQYVGCFCPGARKSRKRDETASERLLDLTSFSEASQQI